MAGSVSISKPNRSETSLQPQLLKKNVSEFRLNIAAFPILADPVDVKKSDQLCETVSQPSIRPDKVDPSMGS